MRRTRGRALNVAEIFALIELFNAWFGGAATTMIGALVGRLM
ncbi:hypothetical protein ACVMB3_005122 [Sinorhizobium meliloti]|nr:hypothetical protein [Sinorhizobium meliloti]